MIYLGRDAVGLVIERGSFNTPIIIPQEYTRLAYLEATGTQCINTGINLKLSSEIELDGCITGTAKDSYPRLCGTSNPVLFFWCIQKGDYTGQIKGCNGYYKFGDSTEKSFQLLPFGRSKHIINKDTYTIIINGNILTGSVGATSITENVLSTITLFCSNNQGIYSNFAAGRIYEYKYSENNIILRHMFPVKRINDNELGMYDIINNVFYTNAGTDEFIAGEVIT